MPVPKFMVQMGNILVFSLFSVLAISNFDLILELFTFLLNTFKQFVVQITHLNLTDLVFTSFFLYLIRLLFPWIKFNNRCATLENSLTTLSVSVDARYFIRYSYFLDSKMSIYFLSISLKCQYFVSQLVMM